MLLKHNGRLLANQAALTAAPSPVPAHGTIFSRFSRSASWEVLTFLARHAIERSRPRVFHHRR